MIDLRLAGMQQRTLSWQEVSYPPISLSPPVLTTRAHWHSTSHPYLHDWVLWIPIISIFQVIWYTKSSSNETLLLVSSPQIMNKIDWIKWKTRQSNFFLLHGGCKVQGWEIIISGVRCELESWMSAEVLFFHGENNLLKNNSDLNHQLRTNGSTYAITHILILLPAEVYDFILSPT